MNNKHNTFFFNIIIGYYIASFPVSIASVIITIILPQKFAYSTSNVAELSGFVVWI